MTRMASMSPAEFDAARRMIGKTDTELAAVLRVKPEVLLRWEAGTASIPRRKAAWVARFAAEARREVVLRSSGLPECDWMTHLRSAMEAGDAATALPDPEEIRTHLETCRTCLDRQRYADQHAGPLPPMPRSLLLATFEAVERIPPFIRPAAFGAFMLGAWLVVPALLLAPFVVRSLSDAGQGLLVVAAAIGAGAAGGLAYSLVHPITTKLGVFGPYLTGVACVAAYMGVLAAVGPSMLGDSGITDQSDAVVFAIITLFFGLVVGHFWFGKGKRFGTRTVRSNGSPSPPSSR